ncbi:hypothetical protein F5Y17DRAFT_413186 [Xylariaceae sp. FL0594]|nr:hypothetical protein F5Y17DRAFT_413186 [Xylariaceae sp. FL0594]
MESIETGMHTVSLAADKARKSPETRKRPTPQSLPKLEIEEYYGPLPEEVPASRVEGFMKYVAIFHRAPPSNYDVRGLGSRASRKERNISQNIDDDDEKKTSPDRPKPPYHPNFSKWNAVDPYDVNPPTPPTLQFTEHDAVELRQWREAVGELRDAHDEAFERLRENPKDLAVKAELRAISRARAKKIERIAEIHDRRRIRRDFRKDFNHIVSGW